MEAGLALASHGARHHLHGIMVDYLTIALHIISKKYFGRRMNTKQTDNRPVRLKTPAGKAVFGPVPSRRLGMSLGVDLLWPKTCTLDCRYCECGPTDKLTMQRGGQRDTEQVLSEVHQRVAELPQPPDFITLAGSGEPTLHSDLGYVIHELKKICPAKVAVLTNGTLLWDPQVRAELMEADLLVPSLDAVSERSFRRVNRPAKGLDLKRIIEGIAAMRAEFKGGFVLEILLVKGMNDSEEEIEAFIKAVKRINPEKVQLNTVVRPPADGVSQAVGDERLREISRRFSVPCEVIAPPQKAAKADHGSIAEVIVEMTRRRPLNLDDVAASVGIGLDEAQKLVEGLMAQKRLVIEKFGDEVFYRGKE
jgi:wyosine [tRNA(Phe)-imidazoG37] synthetase (radical SAM superfamily)